MKTVSKKLLSLLLVAMLLISAIPFQVFADGETPEPPVAEEPAAPAGEGEAAEEPAAPAAEGEGTEEPEQPEQPEEPEQPEQPEEPEEPAGSDVKFIVDGIEYATITQTVDAAAVVPATPYKTGYDFKGWWSEPDGQGYRIAAGIKWAADLPTTYYAHFVSNKVVDENTIRIFVKHYVGTTLRGTREIDSVKLETGENAFNWLYANKDRVDALIEAAYGTDYAWNPQYYYNYSGNEVLTEQNLTANGTKSVCVKIYNQNEAKVLVYVHRNKATATPVIYEMKGYLVNDVVSYTAVQNLLKNYYSGNKMTMEGLYNDEAWTDVLQGKKPTQASGVTVDSQTFSIHVLLKNATATSSGTADSTNPKTGDTMLPVALSVMAISAMAAAAVYVMGKKRRA